MTPCEKLSYKVGDKFTTSYSPIFSDGSVVSLYEDDGTTSVLFKLEEGDCSCDNCYGKAGGFVNLDFVKPLVKRVDDKVEEVPAPSWAKFKLGDEVKKVKGSQWHGNIVGYYSTTLTPHGYAVESRFEKGSVQIYPEAALKGVENE